MSGKANTRDMTTGSPIKHILMFALPLLVGNLFQQLYNMVDSLIVGNYVGADALAAVGTCGSMNSLFFALAHGLAIGTGIMVAQYFGAHDEKRIRAVIANSIYGLGTVALTAGVLGIVLSPFLLKLLSTPERILGDAVIYMRVTFAGLLAIALYEGAAAVLRALGDSRTPLYFLILASIVNVVLDLMFVLRFGWGVFGVAFATIISQAVAAVTCILYAYRKVSYFRLTREEMKPDKAMIARSFQLGLPLALQSSMISISCLVLQGVINSFGETVMATSTIINRIEQLIQQPYSSLAAALTTYTGQNIGARQTDRVRKGYRQSILVVLFISGVMIPAAYLFGDRIVGAFVKEPEVIAMGITALRINSSFYFVLGIIHVSRAVLNGCGDTGFAMMNGFTEVVCRVLFSQALTGIPALGYWGIWLTTGVTWSATALVCVIRYASGVWKKKSMVGEKQAVHEKL